FVDDPDININFVPDPRLRNIAPLYAGPPGSRRRRQSASVSSSYVPGDGTKFICVTRGTRVGVYANWDAAQQYCSGISHSGNSGYKRFEAACDMFDRAWTEGKLTVL
ncbi:hypothetical protein SISSUDRAFT_1038724, partial [Sistotremastrum suecicum HHB10207 ss-3]